jgi:hypothetical protein
MDKEFLQYIKETGYNDLLDFDEKTVLRYKDTFHYQNWLLWKALKVVANEMRETKLGSMIISFAKFLDKCIEKIF